MELPQHILSEELKLFFMSGAGNLFTVIDNRGEKFSVEDGKRLASVLCSAPVAPFATEGLMLISESEAEDFRMDFFNPDGSYGAMCGNGGRCAVYFAATHGFFSKESRFVHFTAAGTHYRAELKPDGVRLYFPPQREYAELVFSAGDLMSAPENLRPTTDFLSVGYVNVGSDHAVIDTSSLGVQSVEEFQQFDVQSAGEFVRRHALFGERGANANFYFLDGKTVLMRTFERGVEAETGACGTGAISTALVVSRRNSLGQSIRLIPTSGSPLLVEFLPNSEKIEEIVLEGGAIFLEERKITREELQKTT